MIPMIYDAGLGKLKWSDVLDRVAHLLDSPIAALGVLTRNTRLAVANKNGSSLTPNVEAVCLQPAMCGSSTALIGQPVISSAVVPGPTSGPSCGQRIIANQSMEIIQALLFREPDCTGMFAAARAAREGPFTSTHVESVRALWQHLGQAIRIQLRLAIADSRNSYLTDALDQVGNGVIVVDSGARILHVNHEARTMIVDRDIVRADRESHGGCTLRRPLALVKLVTSASTADGQAAGPRSMLLRSPTMHRPVSATVVPFPCVQPVESLTERPAALILLADPERSDAHSKQFLQAVYGLTPAEAAVVDLIARGIVPKEVARRLSVAPSTVRTHLHHVFEKTGVSRQAELAYLVQRLPTLVRRPNSATTPFLRAPLRG
jgi:DNA-binding CsgD family transcriptional regulator